MEAEALQPVTREMVSGAKAGRGAQAEVVRRDLPTQRAAGTRAPRRPERQHGHHGARQACHLITTDIPPVLSTAVSTHPKALDERPGHG